MKPLSGAMFALACLGLSAIWLSQPVAREDPAERRAARQQQQVEQYEIRRARRDALERHQRLSVVIADIWGEDREELRRFCARADIDVFEVPLYIAATSTSDDRMDLVLGRYDRHWNAKANTLIADEIQRIQTERHR